MLTRISFWGSLVLGIGLFYVFLVWQFPYADVRRAIVEGLEGSFPAKVTLSRVSFSFPAGVRLEGIRGSSEEFSFQAPDLVLHPDILRLQTGAAEMEIRDAGSASRIRGRFAQTKNGNRLDLTVKQAEIRASSQKDFSFTLKVSGETSLDWKGEDWESGSGRIWAMLERGNIQGAGESGAPAPLALFDNVKFEAEVKNGIIQVKRFEAGGRDNRFALPAGLQFPLKGGLPAEVGLFLQIPPPKAQ